MTTVFLYILSNPERSGIFIGTTSDLSYAMWQHSTGIFFPHTRKYRFVHLIYLECFSSIATADSRRRALRFMRLEEKWKKISSSNPGLHELISIGS
ncbi:MAG: hypothetical protein EOO01_23565 [Chitinophagaceae bacterium]|nr:MAG: hypothetical protein EOO01_23565 [Chitinophagaceae bacterium]